MGVGAGVGSTGSSPDEGAGVFEAVVTAACHIPGEFAEACFTVGVHLQFPEAPRLRDFPPVSLCPQKKNAIAKTPDHKDTGTTSAFVFVLGAFGFSALAPNVPIEPKLGRAGMNSLLCTPVSVPKRQRFSCTSWGRTSSLKFENVVPGT